MPFCIPVYIEHIYSHLVIICSQFCVWQMLPAVELIVQSPFAPSPLQRLHRYYELIRQSYSPVELRLSNLYQQPLLSRTFPTLIFDPF